MSMAIQSEVTVTRVGRPCLVSEATNQSQFLPTCVSGFVFCFLFFFYIYIFVVVVGFYFIFNSLFSSKHNGTAYYKMV